MSSLRYRFHLVCPRCDKQSEITGDKRVPPPHVNCGDCLMDDVEVVEMNITSVDVEIVGL